MTDPQSGRHPLGPRRFSFAVVSDTHLNEEEAECNSPYKVNLLANARMRYVIADLNARDLAFVMHLGDLIHPVPSVPSLYERAAEKFRAQTAELRHPLHLLPGNHDIGDKRIAWGPTAPISDAAVALWRETFGPDFHSFAQDGCRFVALNAQLINSGLAAEDEQRAWLEGVLEAAEEGERIFLFLHYPPFMTEADEPEHYDNIAEPGRSWLLDLAGRAGVEAMFSGHVHNFWFHRHAGVDCYQLPSTVFVRQDYSELSRAAPALDSEAGRNDEAKLGYLVIHVHEDGHYCEIVRSHGRTLAPDAPVGPTAAARPSSHPVETSQAPFGVDMRQDWLEIVEIPPSGGLDEFDRKRVRNDYPLMALWESGLGALRLPATDLLSPERRARLAALADHGLRYRLFAFGAPEPRLLEPLRQAASMVEALEIAYAPDSETDEAESAARAVEAWRACYDGPLFLSPIRRHGGPADKGKTYYHVITHGFLPEEGERIAGLKRAAAFDGAVFRIGFETAPWEAIRDAAALCDGLGLAASSHLRLAGENPAVAVADEIWAAGRVAEAIAASVTTAPRHRVYVDSFADFDRGFFPRMGLYDKRYNPRAAGLVVRHLFGLLRPGASPWSGLGVSENADLKLCALEGQGDRACLLLPKGALSAAAALESAAAETGAGRPQRLVDLVSGFDLEPSSAPLGTPALALWG